MMMRCPVFLLFFALLFFAGCYNTATDAEGRSCRALSEGEIRELVDFTRMSMMHNVKKRLIFADEADFALRHEPDVVIEYRGDRFGTAKIFWRTPHRTIGMLFEGEFTVEKPTCALIVQDNPHLPGIQPDKSLQGR